LENKEGLASFVMLTCGLAVICRKFVHRIGWRVLAWNNVSA
ncbi:MAG: hypothetical protein ACI81Q_002161, partial [Paracoccaceae bacterium]